jgi:patatin-like phospholipase/acyl hydrolase
VFKILSLDGGGIRGAFIAAFLAKLQENLEQPLIKYFDLVTGTSTGGLIAVALAMGTEASELYCGPVLRHPAGPIQAANFRSGIAF